MDILRAFGKTLITEVYEKMTKKAAANYQHRQVLFQTIIPIKTNKVKILSTLKLLKN